jgi:hypothetical protein
MKNKNLFNGRFVFDERLDSDKINAEEAGEAPGEAAAKAAVTNEDRANIEQLENAFYKELTKYVDLEDNLYLNNNTCDLIKESIVTRDKIKKCKDLAAKKKMLKEMHLKIETLKTELDLQSRTYTLEAGGTVYEIAKNLLSEDLKKKNVNNNKNNKPKEEDIREEEITDLVRLICSRNGFIAPSYGITTGETNVKKLAIGQTIIIPRDYNVNLAKITEKET